MLTRYVRSFDGTSLAVTLLGDDGSLPIICVSGWATTRQPAGDNPMDRLAAQRLSSKENVALSNGVVRSWPGGGIEASALTSGQITRVEVTGNGPVVTGYGSQMTIGSHVILSDCIVASSAPR